MPFTAVKPIYNRSKKRFDLEIAHDAEPTLAHSGYFVFDDAARVLPKVQSRALLGHWSQPKRDLVIDFLSQQIAAQTVA